MNILLTISSIIIVILFVIFSAFLAFFTFNFFSKHLMKKRSDVTKRAFFLLFVSIVGMLIRLVCAFEGTDLTNKEFGDFLIIALKTVYSTFGVFSFEGQEVVSPNHWANTFMFVTIWVAVTYFVIIFAGFNYGFQSWFSLLNHKVLSFFTFSKMKEKALFIFDNVNKESIALADSICEQYSELNSLFLIVFLVDENDSFDRKNPLHKEIRSKNYLFLTRPKAGSKEEYQSLVNVLFKHLRKNYNVNIFMMEADKKGLGQSVINAQSVYDDVFSLFRDNLTILKKNSHFYYHVYVENEIIFHYINHIISNTIGDVFKQYGNKIKSKYHKDINEIKNEYYQILTVGAFSIPSLCENALELSRKEYQIADIKDHKQVNYEEDKVHRVFVFGFNPIAQASLNSLYMYTAGLDVGGSGKPYKFEAHIFDNHIDEYSETYERKRPMMIFHHVDFGDNKENIHRQEIINVYGSEEALEEIGVPNIYFHKIDYKNVDIVNELEKRGYNIDELDSVIVSLGSDEVNTEVVDILRGEIETALKNNKSERKIDIYVHISNENNFLTNKEVESPTNRTLKVRVISYGNYHQLFSFKHLINSRNVAVTEFINELKSKISKKIPIEDDIRNLNIDNYFLNKKINHINSGIIRTDSIMHTLNFYSLIKEYLTESNIGKGVSETNSDSDELLKRLYILTHEFWCRYKISGGNKYIQSVENESKQDQFDHNLYDGHRMYTRDRKMLLDTLICYEKLSLPNTINHVKAFVSILLKTKDKSLY